MAGRWVPAQDLFDEWSRVEDDLAFDRAGGQAYDFDLTPPVSGGSIAIAADEDVLDVDEFELEDALMDAHTTATLRVMAAEITDTMSLLDDDITGTLPAMA